MKNRTVPILITSDVDPTPEVTLENKKRSLSITMELFKEFGIRSTFFFVANTARHLSDEISALKEHNHEIGCHGLTHGYEEEYDKMPEQMQQSYLESATEILDDLAQSRMRSFRGPRVKTSHVTQGILEDLGYVADSSVCSQRMDLISSNLVNTGWIFAPRMPYHPNKTNAYRRGNRTITVVPVSAMIFPFVSGMIYTFGLSIMKVLFDIFYLESMRTGKPIVYLLHPAEFARPTEKVDCQFSIKNIFVEGFPFRRANWLFESDIKKRYEGNRGLFAHMKSHANVRFMTVHDYVHSKYTTS